MQLWNGTEHIQQKWNGIYISDNIILLYVHQIVERQQTQISFQTCQIIIESIRLNVSKYDIFL